MKRHSAQLTAALVTVLASTTTAQEIQYEKRPYAVIELGNLGVQTITTAYSLNSQGEVAGASFIVQGEGDRLHAMLWRNGVMEDLNPALEGQTKAWGINDALQIVGEAAFDDLFFPGRAFLWEDGVMIDLGTLGGDYSVSLAINNAGQVVGRAQGGPSGDYMPFMWQDGVMTSLLSSCSDCGGRANAINEHGVIVGNATIREQNIEQYPVLWDADGNMTILHEGRGSGSGINNHGYVAGRLEGTSGRAVLWEPDGTMIELDDGGSWGSTAVDINDHGIIIGGDGTAAGRAAVWTPDGTRYTVNYLTAPLNAWRIESVWDINNNNQIAARGRTQNGSNVQFAFLLTPVTPRFEITEPTPAIAGKMNEITARGGDLEPGMRVNFYWGVHGGGMMFPTHSCNLLDAVLQIENAKWAGSAIADENGIATLRGTVPAIAKDEILLFQAMVPARFTADNKCMQSSFVIVQFE